MRIQDRSYSTSKIILLFILILTIEILLLASDKQKVIHNDTISEQTPMRGEYYEYNQLPRALNSANVSFLYALRKGVIDSSIITTMYSGKIAKIYREPTSYYYSKYFRGLKITRDKGEGYIFFTSKSLRSAQFFNQTGQAITFQDLREGQTVLVHENINMLEKEIDTSRTYTFQIL